MRTTALLAIIVILSVFPVAQERAMPYDVDEAYEIYSLLLPREEVSELTKSTLIIREEAVSREAESGACLTPEAARRFREALSAYNELQMKELLFQRKFHIDRPYEVVPKAKIGGGFIFMSPVGFNSEKNLAVVYMGSTCGGLCGHAQFHLFEKTAGHWKEVPGVKCVVAS